MQTKGIFYLLDVENIRKIKENNPFYSENRAIPLVCEPPHAIFVSRIATRMSCFTD